MPRTKDIESNSPEPHPAALTKTRNVGRETDESGAVQSSWPIPKQFASSTCVRADATPPSQRRSSQAMLSGTCIRKLISEADKSVPGNKVSVLKENRAAVPLLGRANSGAIQPENQPKRRNRLQESALSTTFGRVQSVCEPEQQSSSLPQSAPQSRGLFEPRRRRRRNLKEAGRS
ncbi:hypothetical protein B0H10DRAFT_2190423 [Mycena sp. CBHHK59/15]|nr:hypothetical protein B0H10DRAFT_2190423 [Mycena sp. CBHHK59/15]